MNKNKIYLTNEQIQFLTEMCNYEIEENKEVIKDLKESKKIGKKKEIKSWLEENKFIKDLIYCLNNKTSYQVVLQELTPKQEDYILESGLEQIREAREK